MLLEWIKNHEEGTEHPMRDPASASALLADLRGADPAAALNALSGWLESVRDAAGFDEKRRSDVLSLIQEAGTAHVSVLLAQYLANPAGRQAVRESTWKSLFNYLSGLVQALCASAEGLIRAAKEDASFLLPGAAAAARSLRACRLLAKVCLVHYSSVPPKLWRLAYSVHAAAEKAGCATTLIPPHAMHDTHKTVTTVAQELLRLLLPQVSAPEMMAPEQVEVADRVVEQLGEDFTLRPRGVTDNPFCFDPASDLPPRRASGGQAAPDAGARYFGPGIGLDALERVYKQLATARSADIKVFGKDLAPHTQIATVQHLLMFWRAESPYSPPAHSQATGDLHIIHRYAQIWRCLSRSRSAAGGLTIEPDEGDDPQAEETWMLRAAGGNELGAEIPQHSSGWAKCGEVVGVSPRGGGNFRVGVIRRMHAESGRNLHADIAVLSRDPQAVSLRALLAKGEESVYSEASSQQFAFNRVRAIILSDGSEGSQKPNLLLPSESWKEGRLYEAVTGETTRYVRGLHLLRRGDDYVRATFEWVPAPGA